MRLREGSPQQKGMFAVLLGSYVLGVVLTCSHAASLVGRPHSGFFWLGNVVSFGPADVRDAGVAWGSRPLALNDVDITTATPTEIFALEQREQGATNRLTVRRPDGTVVTAAVPVQVYTWRHAFESFGVMILICAVGFLVGVGTFALRPYESGSWALLATVSFVSTGATTLALVAHGVPAWPAVYGCIFLGLIAMFGFHLGLGFPTAHPLLLRRPYVLFPLYGVGLCLGAALIPLLRRDLPLPAWTRITLVAFSIHLVGLLLFAGRSLLLAIRSGERLVRQRARAALAVAFAAVSHRLFESAVLVFGVPVGSRDLFVGYVGAFSTVGVLIYLSLRFDLVNARVAVRRVVAYAGAGILVVVLIALGANVSPALAVAGTIPAFLLWPRFNARVNQWLYPKRAQFPALRRTIGDALLGSTTQEGVLQVLAGAVPQVCDTNSGAAFLLPSDSEGETRVTTSGDTDASNVRDLAREPLVHWMMATHQMVKRETLAVDPQFRAISTESRACMDRLNAAVLLPLVREDRMIGGVVVGPHVSDDVYDPKELELLRDLAHVAVQALEVAELRERSSGAGVRPGARAAHGGTVVEFPLPSVAGGRYVAERLLGEGGSKRVYLAQDTTLQRQVALALIQPGGLDERGRPRIMREARTMATLGSHPHVVTVHDLGEEAGQLYVVSEYLPGADLSARIAAAPERRLPLADVLRIGMEVCGALELAHGQGIVHRDVKPGNIWFTGTGVAKLGDFGLAAGLDQTRITKEGDVLGTAAYMAPEQARGEEALPQSDLYALGVVLYEMAAGRLPFTGDNLVALVHHHLHTEPAPPSHHNPALPAAFDALVLRLLAKAAADRPPSAVTVRAALAEIPT